MSHFFQTKRQPIFVLLMDYKSLYIGTWFERIPSFTYTACMPKLGHLHVFCQFSLHYN